MVKLYDKVLFKIGIVLFVSVVSLFICVNPAWACTGLYVGSQASEDGTSIIARSNDMHPLNEPCYVKIYGGQDGQKLEKISSENGFEYELPEDIHRFITLPTSEYADSFAYITTAINDCGVSISATLTGYCGRESLQYNPHVEGGIVEDMFPAIVGACASNAREGIELIAKIIDQKGSGEDNIIMISDQKECWYMEIYAGHQYCAVKAPDDCVCALGNEFMLETVDKDSKDVIHSKDLFTLPEKYGFAKYNADGKMNLFNTYVGENNFSDYSHLRTWEGHRLLSPATAGEYSKQVKYPLFYKPDNKVSLSKVMDFFRDRYQGTPYYMNKDNHQFRPIATESQLRTHILQTYKDVPAQMACVEWLSMSNAEFSTYVPISNLQSEFDSSYTHNISSYNYDENNAYVNFKTLNTLCDQKRDLVGNQIQSFWKNFEDYQQAAFKNVLAKAKDAADNIENAQTIFNNFGTATEAQANYDAKRLTKNVMWYYDNTEETFQQKFANIKKGDLTYTNQKYDKFNATFDVELFAKLLNWNVDQICIQDHNPDMPDYDNNKIGNEDQADNGGKEGYIKFSNCCHTIELHTNNGHRLPTGKIIVDGQEKECMSFMEDNKIFASLDIADKIKDLSDTSDVSIIENSLASPNRSINSEPKSFWDYITSLIDTFKSYM